ncbi:MAG: NADPH-dependent FMN reductase [Massilia sp.]
MSDIVILAISGSLRAASYNTAVLKAACALASAGISVVLEQGIGTLPLFNPDLDNAGLAGVDAWRARIDAADALLIASPEYAHGVTGVIKNALDWAVSMASFPGKPVALINTSPRATVAQASLREILTTMSASLVEAASISLPLQGSGLALDGILARPEMCAGLAAALDALAQAARDATAQAARERV